MGNTRDLSTYFEEGAYDGENDDSEHGHHDAVSSALVSFSPLSQNNVS